MQIDTQTIQLIRFALRHFTDDFAGTKITKYRRSKNDLTGTQADRFMGDLTKTPYLVSHDTDFPFARLLIVENFTGCMSGLAEITPENKDKLQSGWRVRQEGEKPYYSQWFSSVDIDPEPASYLHIILYSRDQLADEGITLAPGMEWGIVTINAEQHSSTVPPHPNTLLRNAEGIEAGGNGVQYTEQQMADATAYHANWANVL
tara:strand:- start:4725 stop:5333 length:609 start_codon:yes stop_codon:yes gene_type:complete